VKTPIAKNVSIDFQSDDSTDTEDDDLSSTTSSLMSAVDYLAFNIDVEWPSLDTVEAIVETTGSLLDNTAITIKSIELDKIELIASMYDFSSIEDIELSFTLPDETEVTTAGVISSDKKTMYLIPAEDVDLLNVLNQLTETSTTIRAKASLQGDLPDPFPSFSIKVHATVVVSAFISSFRVNVPIEFTIADSESATDSSSIKPGNEIPTTISELGFGFNIAWPTAQAFCHTTCSSIGFGLLSYLIHIDSLTPNKLELVCSEGDFSFLTSMDASIIMPDASTLAIPGTISEDAKTLSFTPKSEVDIMDLIEKYKNKTKNVEASVQPIGVVPTTKTTFDVILNSKISIGLFPDLE
jgi:hypothetical protein